MRVTFDFQIGMHFMVSWFKRYFCAKKGRRKSTAVCQRWMATDLGAEVTCLVAVLSQHFLFTCRTTHHGPSWNAITTNSLLATNFQTVFFPTTVMILQVRCSILAPICRLNELAVAVFQNEGPNCIIHNEIIPNNGRQCQFIVSSDFLPAR